MNMENFFHRPWTGFVALLAATLLTACGGGGGDSGPTAAGGTTGGSNPPAALAPLNVVSTSPADKAAGIALNAPVRVTFNVKAEPATIISPSTAFTVKEFLTGADVPGSVAMDTDGMTAIFTPTATLAANTEYLGTVTTAVQNADGSTLSRDYTWTFTTTSAAVAYTYPAPAATAIATNTKIIAAFNTDIDPATLTATSFTVTRAGGAAVAGTVSYDSKSRTAIFAPAAALQPNTAHTATLTTAVRDERGHPLASTTTWTFTTGSQADTVKPTAPIEYSPGHEQTGVELNSAIWVQFNEPMDPSTITTSSFFIADENHINLPGNNLVFDPVTNTATFHSDVAMTANTRYHIVITPDVKDLAGNTLDTDLSRADIDEFVSFFVTGIR